MYMNVQQDKCHRPAIDIQKPFWPVFGEEHEEDMTFKNFMRACHRTSNIEHLRGEVRKAYASCLESKNEVIVDVETALPLPSEISTASGGNLEDLALHSHDGDMKCLDAKTFGSV